MLKKQAIEKNAWSDFARLKHALEGREAEKDLLQELQVLWTTLVRQWHVRVYHNPEFELTLTEQIEQQAQLMEMLRGNSVEEKKVQILSKGVYNRLKQRYAMMSKEEQAQERQERREREGIRAKRIAAFRRFRDQTYQLLTASRQGQYAVNIQDSTLEGATITETITLPKLPDRQSYPTTSVHFTPEQLEGYLFLAKLGAIGGNPLMRSALVS